MAISLTIEMASRKIPTTYSNIWYCDTKLVASIIEDPSENTCFGTEGYEVICVGFSRTPIIRDFLKMAFRSLLS